MKIVLPLVNHVFDTDQDKINTLVVENSSILYEILTDLQHQLNGGDGKSVVSAGGKPVCISKCVELHVQFVPFILSKKVLLSKMINALEQKAIQEDHVETAEIMGRLETYLTNLAMGLPGDIVVSKVTIGSVLKAVGIEFYEEYHSLCEKIIDYMELVYEYEGHKLFIFLNLRSYITDHEAQLFTDTVLQHRYDVLLIDNHEYDWLINEQRCLVDKDGCEIL